MSNYHGYDLTNLRRLHSDEIPRGLAKSISQFHAACAVFEDLSEALAMLTMWETIVERGVARFGPNAWDSDPELATTASACIKTAVIAYCRAYDGGAEGRVLAPIDEWVSNAEVTDAHAAVITTRNESIAHYDDDKSEVPRWSEMRVFLLEPRPGDFLLSAGYEHARSLVDIARQLKRLLDAVLPQADENIVLKRKEIIVGVHKLIAAGKAELLKLEPLDLNAAGWQPATVDNVLRQASSATIIVKDGEPVWGID